MLQSILSPQDGFCHLSPHTLHSKQEMSIKCTVCPPTWTTSLIVLQSIMQMQYTNAAGKTCHTRVTCHAWKYLSVKLLQCQQDKNGPASICCLLPGAKLNDYTLIHAHKTQTHIHTLSLWSLPSGYILFPISVITWFWFRGQERECWIEPG